MLTFEHGLSMNKHEPTMRCSPVLSEESAAHLSLGHTPMPNFLFSRQHYPLYPPCFGAITHFKDNNKNNSTAVPKRARSAVVHGAEQTPSPRGSCLSLALLLEQQQLKPTSLAGLTDVVFKWNITSTPERACRHFLCRICWGEGGRG